jgi:hypothetical protein
MLLKSNPEEPVFLFSLKKANEVANFFFTLQTFAALCLTAYVNTQLIWDFRQVRPGFTYITVARPSKQVFLNSLSKSKIHALNPSISTPSYKAS